MATLKLTREEQLQRDIDHLDDRVDRLELIDDYASIVALRIERQRLVDDLNERLIVDQFTRPPTMPVAFSNG